MFSWIRGLFSRMIALTSRMAFILAMGVFSWALGTLGLRFPPVFMLMTGFIVWKRMRNHRTSDSHGSATVASLSTIEQGGLFAEDGLILGRCLAESPSAGAAIAALFNPMIRSEMAVRMFLAAFVSKSWLCDQLLRVGSFVHLASISPAGGGKGVGVLIPNLLAYRGNCVVVDPKGELYNATAMHRRKKFGHIIIRLDPFNVCGPGGDTLNAFDFVDHTKDFLDDTRSLSDMQIIRPHDEKEPHWNESACEILTAFSSYVCACEPDRSKRNLSTVRALASSRERYAMAVSIMQQTEGFDGVIERAGSKLTWLAGDELSSILSTFNRHTSYLDSPAVARHVATSSFDPLILRRKKATVYLILPHQFLASHSRLQRLWIGTIMRRITVGVADETRPVLWLLDEMAHIGHMQIIEDAVTLMRGMGIRLWFIFQSFAQIKTCFGEKAAAVVDNIGTWQFFGISSYETAEEISRRIGEATISVASDNTTTGSSYSTGGAAQQHSGNRSTGRSITWSQTARRLIKAEEVLTLNSETVLLFHKNLPVIVARLVKYFNAPEFRKRWNGTRGSAAPRRLGLATAIMASVILGISTLFANVALTVASTRLPEAESELFNLPFPEWAATPDTDLPPPLVPAETIPLPAPAPEPQAWPRRRWRGPSGFLIKIE